MCGRLAFFEPQALKDRYDVREIPLIKPEYNFRPGMDGPVVLKQSPKRIKLMNWGLDLNFKFKLINVRLESSVSKKNRCLIPANGFFEWEKIKGRPPYYFYSQKESIISLAGVFNNNTYAIITTAAREPVLAVHPRMPLIIPKEAEDAWLKKGEVTVYPAGHLVKKHPGEINLPGW
jgi:putative SOS response-associated peptidase YedK